MVCWDAKPTAAPPRAEKATNHSVVNPPTLTIDATAPIRIRMRKVKTKLFVTFGSSLARFANLLRYLVITLSRMNAAKATVATVRICDQVAPKMVDEFK
jgi:hypothetical protein